MHGKTPESKLGHGLPVCAPNVHKLEERTNRTSICKFFRAAFLSRNEVAQCTGCLSRFKFAAAAALDKLNNCRDHICFCDQSLATVTSK